MHIREMQSQAYEIAQEKGWWTEDREIGTLLALIHSEVSEALEEWRVTSLPLNDIRYNESGKPEGFAIELADIMIRLGDMAERYNINLEYAVNMKLIYNRTRSYRHGNKRA